MLALEGRKTNKKPALRRVNGLLWTTLACLLVPRARLELARLAARDFESRASTDSAIGAGMGGDYG